MIINKNYIFLLSTITIIVYLYYKNDKYHFIKKIHNHFKLMFAQKDINHNIKLEGQNVAIPNVKIQQEKIKKYIDYNLNELMQNENKNNQLKEMLKYALEDGKRVRPIIVLTNYNSLSKILNENYNENYSDYMNTNFIINIALSIEYIHCASLILDDMMDNDDYRRDKLSLHIKYGNTMAQLCAIILCAYAMKNIFTALSQLNTMNKDNENYNKNIPIILGNMFSNCITELTIGQYIDINIPNSLYTLSDLGDNIKQKIKMGTNNKYTIEELIHKKTTTLFEYCYIMPWIFTYYNKSDSEIEKGILEMKNIAKHFGLIFQIADDFEDIEQDKIRDGKNSVMNYCINKGVKDAYHIYFENLKKFKELSIQYNIYTNEINEICNYLSKKVINNFYKVH
jgi:geranylgeranyl diphosphate synthase type II